MAALLRYADMTLRYSLVTLLIFVASSESSDPSEGNTTAVEGRQTKTPAWWPFVQCVFLTDVNKCLQDRALRAFVGLDRKDDVYIDTEKETVKLPGENEEGIFEMLGDLVSDGLSKIFQDDKKGEDYEDDDNEEEDEDETDEVQPAENGDSNKLSHESNRTLSVAGNIQRSVETGRTKKKIQKLITLIKIAIAAIVIKLKFLEMLYVFGKIMEFKMVLLVGINTLINLVKLFKEWKKSKEHQNVVHYEEAHHEHIHDGNHFDSGDKGWLGGLWSRSDFTGGRSLRYPQDLAYSAHKPLSQ